MSLADHLLAAVLGFFIAVGVVHSFDVICIKIKRYKEELELKKKSKSS